jgi:hypothetical protein
MAPLRSAVRVELWVMEPTDLKSNRLALSAARLSREGAE